MRKERPIIFQSDMVKAIMYGRKSETRRVVKPQPHITKSGNPNFMSRTAKRFGGTVFYGNNPDLFARNECPYGKPGDLLYVRETFTKAHGAYLYKDGDRADEYFKWKPSIHMPKEAARIWLEIIDVWVERLQDITEESAINEGIERLRPGIYKDYYHGKVAIAFPSNSFLTLFQSIHGRELTEQNPFVWCLKFKVLSINGRPV